MDDPYRNFIPPPEAPVFTPTEEEFADPLGFIAKIRPIAQKSGICKVKPPPDWQPPFAVNVDTFKFTPRVQRLNELEAKTRVKLNFLDQLAKFWELQGCSLKIPHVEKKLLDLYALYKGVEDEGGLVAVTKEKRWNKVAIKIGYNQGKGVGGILKNHYEKILYPFYVFKNSDAYQFDKHKQEEDKHNIDDEDQKFDQDYKPHGIAARTAAGAYVRKNKRERALKEEKVDIDYHMNSELRKLQYFGAGPKAAVPAVKEEAGASPAKEIKETVKSMKTRGKHQGPGVYSDVELYICHMCNRGDGDEYMLLCDGCDDAFHTYCLIPPLADVPKGDWRCPKCVKQACNKPLDPYGFEQAKKQYTLQSFGEMADQFKSGYFNMPVHMVSCGTVEKEFWRLVNSLEDDVLVEYGADIHAAEMGSGFPTKDTKHLFAEDEEYINSGWNLNNLAILEQSVLCHINGDISGMKIPWCYVGMCFSSFCWHIEDHWSYSINYLHWGEPKTWYGVPGESAELFEDVMKKTAPELFEQSPDLLHQLTTIMNPNVLMDQGVPIVRTNQHAGEFVITFPRAYHAGFNQGYNFAEAVNFCPADWLHIGRYCIEHYRSLCRQCVFSHEELICKMAADADRLDLMVAKATYEDMLAVVEKEKMLRKRLLDKGTTEAEREAFELLPDDERQCEVCKTTCFLSAVTCSCRPSRLVCVHHVEFLCDCDPSKHCLRYRYTLDELPAMLSRLKTRAVSFDRWSEKVREAMDASGDDRLELGTLKEMITEADEKRFPESELLQNLVNAVGEAEKCASVAHQLVTKKVRTRNRQSSEGKYIAKLSLEELNCFYEQVSNLPCIIKEAKLIKELVDKVEDFQKQAQEALEAETPDSEKLEKLIEFSATLDVDLQEIPKLRQVLQQAKWLDEVRNTLQDPPNVILDDLRKLMESGVGLAPHPAVEKAMAELQELLTVSERWEEKARICLQARPRHVLATLEAIINEASGIPVYLPNVSALHDALKKAKEWTSKVEQVQNSDSYPYLDALETLVNKGRPIPVRLDQLPQVESQVAAAKSWRERTARTFLKKNSTHSLLEVLSPRADIGIYSTGKNKKKKLRDSVGEKDRRDSENNVVSVERSENEQRDPAAIVAAFKMAEVREVEVMSELRLRNLDKIKQQEDVRYCVCRKSSSGFMLQCELCKDWFHGTCVPLPKSANMKNKSSQAAAVQAAKDLKFLCPLCLRSRRPRLETILSLLVSLQKLPVRLPEGEALQCLTERAMAWQDRARQALTTSELASALAKLSVLSQKMVEQAAREKTEKIINAELMKAANNPELQGHLASVTQSAFGGGSNLPVKQEPSTYNNGDSENSYTIPLSPQSPQQNNSEDIQMEVEVVSSNNQMVGMSEHAYSSASKSSTASSPRKHQRKTPLVARQMEAPVLELSEIAKSQLEDLMMEGDLLEVSLDETQHIWRILQACQRRNDGRYLEFDESDNLVIKERIEKEKPLVKIKKERKIKDPEKEKKKKKRKKEEDVGTVVIKVKKPKETPEGGINKEMKPKKVKKIKKEPPELTKKFENDIFDDTFVSGDMESDLEQIKKILEKSEKPKKTADPDKPKKKRMKVKKEGDSTEKKRKLKVKIKVEKKEKANKMEDEDDDDNDDENCSAIKCLKPTGEEVNWVQCDRCEEWYHLLCVGLGDDEVTEDEEYECFKCKNNGQVPFIPPSLVSQVQDHETDSNDFTMPSEDITLNSENLVIKSEDSSPRDLTCHEGMDLSSMDSHDSSVDSSELNNSKKHVSKLKSLDSGSINYDTDNSLINSVSETYNLDEEDYSQNDDADDVVQNTDSNDVVEEEEENLMETVIQSEPAQQQQQSESLTTTTQTETSCTETSTESGFLEMSSSESRLEMVL